MKVLMVLASVSVLGLMTSRKLETLPLLGSAKSTGKMRELSVMLETCSMDELNNTQTFLDEVMASLDEDEVVVVMEGVFSKMDAAADYDARKLARKCIRFQRRQLNLDIEIGDPEDIFYYLTRVGVDRLVAIDMETTFYQYVGGKAIAVEQEMLDAWKSASN